MTTHGADSYDALLSWWEERGEATRAGLDPAGTLPPPADGWTLLRALLEASFDGIAVNGRASGRFLEVSDSFCDLTGYDRAELLGRTSAELRLVNHRGARRVAVGIYADELRCKDGSRRWVEFSHQFLGEELIVSIVRDITSRRDQEIDLRRLADTDPLTGVLNRRSFVEAADRVLQVAAIADQAVTVLLLDVDDFKLINDQHGHSVGDQVLECVAQVLQGTVRATDTVARLGGDEFAVLLAHAPEPAALRIVAELRRHLCAPLVIDGRQLPLRVSIGVASAARATSAELIDAADRAMYADKRSRLLRSG